MLGLVGLHGHREVDDQVGFSIPIRPVCRRQLKVAMINLGYLTDVEKIRAGHAKRDRAAIANAIPDSMIERLFAFGSEDDCRALLDADFAAGVDTVVVSPQARTAAQFERAAVALKPPR